eukprot:10911720-Heterocapsa_arctica.AAC.1
MGSYTVIHGGIEPRLICAVMVYTQIGNHSPGSCIDTGFLKPSEETGGSPEERRGAIIEFTANIVTNPDDMMTEFGGTRANKLKRDNML